MEKHYTMVRIEKELYEKIQKQAEEQKRSINKQIEFILQKYIDMISK